MEKHKCKLCSRCFSSGRALGGHMRSHLAKLPRPPKTPQKQEYHKQLHHPIGRAGESTAESSTSLSSWEEEAAGGEEEKESHQEKGVVYVLRDNPKKSFRLVDPQFLDGGGSVVQDRGSETETESTRKATRGRSKRIRRSVLEGMKMKKQKVTKPSSAESLLELEPVSSVSDTSPEEDLALCLIMLSRDVWSNSDGSEVLKLSRTPAIPHDAFTGKKIKKSKEESESNESAKKSDGTKTTDTKMHEPPFCGKVFGSGQPLGGHKRSHPSSSSTTLKIQVDENKVQTSNSAKIQEGFAIDLNLPASMEENGEDFWQQQQLAEEASAVSDADFIHPIKR